MGAPRRESGEALDALAEGIAVLRALWTPGPAVTYQGRYYQLDGVRPGPIPPHRSGIWLGAYKPRMLRLTGRLADGWLPSAGYAPPTELPAMIRIIDAASAPGRDPALIRRAYNINGQFSTRETGFLAGPPRLWTAQLTDLVLEHGFSAFIFAPGQDVSDDLQRFAEEVAPAVREAGAAAWRAGSRAPLPQAQPPKLASAAQVLARTSPAPSSRLLPETERPHLARRPGRNDVSVTPAGRRNQETLVAVHDHLRDELAQIRDAASSWRQAGPTRRRCGG